MHIARVYSSRPCCMRRGAEDLTWLMRGGVLMVFILMHEPGDVLVHELLPVASGA